MQRAIDSAGPSGGQPSNGGSAGSVVAASGGSFASGGAPAGTGPLGGAPALGGSTGLGGATSSGGGNSAGASSASGGSAANAGSAGSAGQIASSDPPGVPAPPYTFPQNFRSSYCVYPTTARSTQAASKYARWKADLVTSDGAGGFRRVRRPNNEMDTTVSEGIGYGMILAVVMDDQPLLDDLWKYSQQYLNGNGLMNWEIGADGSVAGQGAATDADEDIAWALVLADKKWGGQGTLDATYQSLAKEQIDRIWNHEVDHSRGELLVAGDSWGWVVYNPSYFAPNEYRAFGKLSGNVDGWNHVIDKGYEMLGRALTADNGNADNGLVPAWTDDNATPSPAFPGAPTHYQYDSARVPFRIGLDYCESGDARAKAYLAKVSTFFAQIGAANIVDGYELNGTPKPENSMQSALFVGAAAVGAMSDAQYQPFVDDAYTLLVTKEMYPPSYYFNLSWDVFSVLMLTGNLFDYTAH